MFKVNKNIPFYRLKEYEKTVNYLLENKKGKLNILNKFNNRILKDFHNMELIIIKNDNWEITKIGLEKLKENQ